MMCGDYDPFDDYVDSGDITHQKREQCKTFGKLCDEDWDLLIKSGHNEGERSAIDDQREAVIDKKRKHLKVCPTCKAIDVRILAETPLRNKKQVKSAIAASHERP